MLVPLFILWAFAAHYARDSELHAAASWGAHATHTNVSTDDIESSSLIIAHYRKSPPKNIDDVLTHLATQLIHDLELNPRPNDTTTYLCGVCQSDVNWEQKAVCCDQCDVWYHIECQNIHSDQYIDMDSTSVRWECHQCLMPNMSPDTISIQNTENNTGESSVTFENFSTFESPGQPQATRHPLTPHQRNLDQGETKLRHKTWKFWISMHSRYQTIWRVSKIWRKALTRTLWLWLKHG